MKRFFVGLLTIIFTLCLFVSLSSSAFIPSLPTGDDRDKIEILVTTGWDLDGSLNSFQNFELIRNTPPAFLPEDQYDLTIIDKLGTDTKFSSLRNVTSYTEVYNGWHLLQRE